MGQINTPRQLTDQNGNKVWIRNLGIKLTEAEKKAANLQLTNWMHAARFTIKSMPNAANNILAMNICNADARKMPIADYIVAFRTPAQGASFFKIT